MTAQALTALFDTGTEGPTLTTVITSGCVLLWTTVCHWFIFKG